ncbi:MAG: hypothetical protein J6P02_00680 [Lachnospiraceae bacterium]|nr:hypothetical protein [Lachnospiraceae bacterium]
MREIVRKNKIIYNYELHTLSDGTKAAIILYAVAVLLLLVSILISYILLGEAPTIIAGLGISSIIFNIGSMLNIILEVYLYNNFHPEIRTMLLLQLVLFFIWIFII